MSDEILNTRRRGKIAQLPRHVREELNRRLDDGQQGPQILPWLNGLAETKALLAEKFASEPISDNNLSQWFKGGFQEWLAQQREVEKTTSMAELAVRIAKSAGGSIAEGALAVAAGKVLGALESAEGEGLLDLVTGVATLRGKEIDAQKLEVAKHRTRQRDEVIALEREKFQRLVVGKFIDFAENEKALEIAKGEGDREVRMDSLIPLMFGPRPSTPDTAA